MKPKVLILGCSFTAGRYSLAHDNTDIIHTDFGWYDQLSKDYDYTVYSFHGGGAINYAYVIRTLHEQNKLKDYEHCIIQQTWEPRFMLYHSEEFEGPVVIDNRTLYTQLREYLFRTELDNPELDFFLEHRGLEYNTTFENEHKKYLHDIGKNSHLTNTIYSSYALINNLLLQSKVKGCTFSLFPKFDTTWAMPDIKQLEFDYTKFIDIMSSSMLKVNDATTHLDLEHTTRLGNLVSSAFDKYLHE